MGRMIPSIAKISKKTFFLTITILLTLKLDEVNPEEVKPPLCNLKLKKNAVGTLTETTMLKINSVIRDKVPIVFCDCF